MTYTLLYKIAHSKRDVGMQLMNVGKNILQKAKNNQNVLSGAVKLPLKKTTKGVAAGVAKGVAKTTGQAAKKTTKSVAKGVSKTMLSTANNTEAPTEGRLRRFLRNPFTMYGAGAAGAGTGTYITGNYLMRNKSDEAVQKTLLRIKLKVNNFLQLKKPWLTTAGTLAGGLGLYGIASMFGAKPWLSTLIGLLGAGLGGYFTHSSLQNK